MNKKIVFPLGILAVGGIIVALLFVGKPKPEPVAENDSPALIKVMVTEAKQQRLRLAVLAQGTVTPKREINLVAQVSGLIVNVEPAFDDGGFFEPHQVLIKIDDREYQAALLVAKARVAEAEYRLAEEQGLSRQAKREWRDLGNQNANDLFMRKPQLAAAKANLESAKGAVTIAQLNVQRTSISVPFTGRVKETFVDLGQYITVGSSLATVYDSTTVEVRLALTEHQASLVNLPFMAQSKTLEEQKLPGVQIRGSVAGKVHQWQGELARTDAFVDSNSRMYYAVVEVENPFQLVGQNEAPLLPGLFVEAEIEGKLIDGVMELPRSALYQRDKIVYLDSDNTVVMQKVKVLRRSDDTIWVQGELDANTLVAIEKQSVTPTGTTVEPLLESDINTLPVATREPVKATPDASHAEITEQE
ncbi:efflux RND transporter periplasmic adaptor subunit [Teredinibacter purpureus]|uniref:efflux RND transporter periplasmic adaptor subunit n=1 Tax=Teredinibacter purpureus TaxID=2731756 RepID=UPI000698BA06|nr:efflux RND transporter periplasmic adaptor subunit [Teredinibacter purpureus]